MRITKTAIEAQGVIIWSNEAKLAQELENLSLNIIAVNSLSELIGIAANEEAICVLLQISWHDAIEALAAIRQHDNISKIPVLIIDEAGVTAAQKLEAIRTGVSNIIPYHQSVPDIALSLRALMQYFMQCNSTHQSLEQGEQNYMNLFNSIDDCIYILDESGKLIDVNNSVLKTYGYTKEEVISKSPSFLAATRKDIENLITQLVHATLKYNSFPSFEMWGKKKNGEKFPNEIICNAGKYFGKDVIIATARDITGRKKAQNALKESEEKLSKVFNLTPDGILLTKVNDGVIIDANETAAAMGGYRRQEIIGKKTLELGGWLSPSDRADYVRQLEKYGRVKKLEKTLMTKSGKPVTAAIWGEIIDINNERCVLSVIQDITESKAAEAAIKESELRWQYALEGAQHGVWDWNLKTNTVFYSQKWKEMLGYAEDEISDSPEEWRNRVHPEDFAATDEKLSMHLQGETTLYENEYRMLCKNGEYCWVLDSGKIISYDEQGHPLRMIGTHLDITNRKHPEDELQRTLAKLGEFKYALDLAANVSITDNLGIIRHVNENFCRHYGYSAQELIGNKESLIHADTHSENFWKEIWEIIKTGKVHKAELQNRKKDGTLLWADTTIVPFIDAEGQPYQFLAISHDITEKKMMADQEAEQQLNTQRSITEYTIREQETEKSKISNELHENINQILAAAKIYLGIVQAKSQEADPMLAKSYDSLDQAMELINKLSSSLNTPLIEDFGLLTVLGELAEEINKSNTIHVTLKDKTNGDDFADYNRSVMLYRIIQLQIDNIIKHARAQHAVIALECRGDKIYLEISDDGQGCDIHSIPIGYGLTHIRNRVELYGGKLRIKTSPGNGWMMHIVLPAKAMFEQQGETNL